MVPRALGHAAPDPRSLNRSWIHNIGWDGTEFLFGLEVLSGGAAAYLISLAPLRASASVSTGEPSRPRGWPRVTRRCSRFVAGQAQTRGPASAVVAGDPERTPGSSASGN
jgi:hypothetical protein